MERMECININKLECKYICQLCFLLKYQQY